MRAVSPERIPLPKFVTTRPPPRIGWNFSQFRVNPENPGSSGSQTPQPEEVQQVVAGPATSGSNDTPEETRSKKAKQPPDTDCIGLKSRFSFTEESAPTVREYVGQKECQEKRANVIQDRFHTIVTETLQESSTLYMYRLEPRHQEDGIRKAASGAPSTCERMLDQWTIWENHCASTGTNPGAPKLHQLHDFLVDAQTGSIMDRGKKRQRSAIGLLRAIGWTARKAQCDILLRMPSSRTITAFWEKKEDEERKETMALPGRAIADFEWRCNIERSSIA